MRLGNARIKLMKRFSVQLTDKTAKALKLRFAAVCFRAVYEVDRYFLAGLFVLFLKAQSLKLLAAHIIRCNYVYWSSRTSMVKITPWGRLPYAESSPAH